jgi:hypothetical protein
MIALFKVAQQLQKICEQQQWEFCFIGGVALQRWGEPRVTQDVDVTLLTGFGNEESFIRILLTHFEARISNAETFALRRRVLLLKSDTGIGIDIALGALDFEQSVVRRASDYEVLPGISLRICSAEDLLIQKAFADRPQDWVDIEGIIIRQKGRLDWTYIHEQLTPLVELKEQPEILEKLKTLKAKII